MSSPVGFVLLEVVIALVILSVAGAAVTALVVDARRTVAGIVHDDALLVETMTIADSVWATGSSSGVRTVTWGRVEWGPDQGETRLIARENATEGTPGRVRVELRIPPPEDR